MSFSVYIPARFAASRLPGKPLLEIQGKPLIQYVYENASKSGASNIVIATDDERIATAASKFGAHAVMTKSDHQSGTDRIAEAVEKCEEPEDQIIVNVQGDEPLLPAKVIRQVAEGLGDDNTIHMATVCEPLEDKKDLSDPNIVKVTRGTNDRALYFSRAAIPHLRESEDEDAAIKASRRHVGIYAYRAAFLKTFVSLPPSQLELIERLEQLRALSNGYDIRVVDACATCGIGVDTQADLDRLIHDLS